MISARDAMTPLLEGLVPVPAVPQVGVCRLCHSSVDESFTVCSPCNSARSIGAQEVLPITMEIRAGLVHDHLRNYKDGPSQLVRDRFGLRLAGLLASFTTIHHKCIGDWDLVTCVPSVSRTALASVVTRIGSLTGDYRQVISATPGKSPRTLDADRFRVTEEVRGRRILLLDDTFTSGAAIYSACAALSGAGAEVVGPVVIGRFVDRSWPPSEALLSWLEPREWDETRCARCDGELRGGKLL